jgi:hypothetical protein
MRVEWTCLKNKKCIVSVLLVCVLVATNMLVIFPLTAPKAKAVVHDTSTSLEDGNPLYDMDGVPGKNNYVLWDVADDHIISDPMGYTVDLGYTLEIPNLNYQLGLPAENVIEFQGSGTRIDVFGTLITNPCPPPHSSPQWTAFTGGGVGGWDGIYFHPGSKGHFCDCLIQNSNNGIVMEPGSYLIDHFPTSYYGVAGCRFEEILGYGMQMDGVLGNTNIYNTNFYELGGAPSPIGIGLVVQNGALNLSSSVAFNSHGSGKPSLHVNNANVYLDQVPFFGDNQPGYGVFVEGASDGTELDGCGFWGGVAGNHYIRCDGSSILIHNNTFDLGSGQLTLLANDSALGAAHPILRNPNPAAAFDNTTIEAMGVSSVTLQWFKDVHVEDPDGHPIVNRPVWIVDRLGNPAQPPMKMTDSSGWARWFIVTELIQYYATRDVFNPFNVSAQNNTLYGYAHPEETISKSMVNYITVPLYLFPSPSPSPPVGLQAKLVGSITNVMLSWNASADDGKGENDVVGYTVYKSSTGVNGNYAFAAWIEANGSASYNWTDLNAGDGDWNNYFYMVRANDTLNTEEKNTNKAGKFVNLLANGWNLISLPLIQTDTSKEYVLYSMDGNYVTIQRYHAGKSRPWLHWHKGKPNFLNDQMQMNHIEGYYIDIMASDYLVVAGKVPTNTQISLKAGWNLVDYPCLTNRTVSDALSSIAGKYNKVEYYDPLKDREVELGLSDYMQPGLGYWIHATEDCVWEI